MGFNEISKGNLEKYFNFAGAEYTNDFLRGKWQIGIIMLLRIHKRSFSGLKKEMPLITDQVLARKLKVLEKEEIIKKKIYPEVPPRTEYSLTSKGKELAKIVELMQKYGLKYSNKLKQLKKS